MTLMIKNLFAIEFPVRRGLFGGDLLWKCPEGAFAAPSSQTQISRNARIRQISAR